VRGVAPSLPLDQQYDIAFDAKSAEDGQPMPNQMGMSQLAMRARQQQDNFGGTVAKTVGKSCRNVAFNSELTLRGFQLPRCFR
jgi:hypothetical protein